LAAPSFDSSDASFGNWEAGWRSQDPKPSDTIAINFKKFFIRIFKYPQKKGPRSKSEKTDFQKEKEEFRISDGGWRIWEP
jgi:hypothetical protein